MKLAKNMILIKDLCSCSFKVSRKKNLVEITYYQNSLLQKKEQFSLDIGSIEYYTLLNSGYREAF